MEKLEKLAADPACVAIGETGLDFNRNFSDPNIQEEVFEKQVWYPLFPCRVSVVAEGHHSQGAVR